jgi:hypothetical protein
MKSILALAFLTLASLSVVAGPVPPYSRPAQARIRTHRIQNIYVGDMGKADEASRFRLLLEDELAKKGFVIVDSADQADGVLTGVLSLRVLDEKSQARVYVTMNSPDGQRIWARDFGERVLVNPFKRTEPVKRRAQEVAKELEEEWGKQ